MKTGGKQERSSHLGILSFHCLSVVVQVVCTLLYCHVSLGHGENIILVIYIACFFTDSDESERLL